MQKQSENVMGVCKLLLWCQNRGPEPWAFAFPCEWFIYFCYVSGLSTSAVLQLFCWTSSVEGVALDALSQNDERKWAKTLVRSDNHIA